MCHINGKRELSGEVPREGQRWLNLVARVAFSQAKPGRSSLPECCPEVKELYSEASKLRLRPREAVSSLMQCDESRMTGRGERITFHFLHTSHANFLVAHHICRTLEENKKATVDINCYLTLIEESGHSQSSVKIATTSGTRIGDSVRGKRPVHHRPLSQVYKIPCGGWDKVCIGETGRGLHEQRIGHHRHALRRHDTKSTFVVHVDNDGHLPKWCQASITKQGLAPRQRKMIEAALIHSTINMNAAQGTHDLSKVAARLIICMT
ncbi:uncharacterized protein LOC122262189 [Penaeus japonicus]|uniref:uncharacterized protein LOC122262189 n=1 Tax=Penaeus japonicus TaxID=27405 RepID=UPI001C70C545|nr:uncharacterized protein LOC122262189 [Penaeus japonicus]